MVSYVKNLHTEKVLQVKSFGVQRGREGHAIGRINGFSRSVAARRCLAGAEAETFEHRGIALSPASAPRTAGGPAVLGAEKRRSPVLARGAAVCGAEVFDDFIGLAFQRGIVATRGRASQTAMP